MKKAPSNECVINQYGRELPYEAVVELMDDDIREAIHRDLAPCTYQEFFDEYCRRYLVENEAPSVFDQPDAQI